MRLSKSGHVFLAKGSTPSDLKKMHREAKYYDHLQRLQGVHVPVYTGTLELQGDDILKYDTWDGELVIAGLLLLGSAGYGVDSSPHMESARWERQATLWCSILHSRCARPCRKFTRRVYDTGTWPCETCLFVIQATRRPNWFKVAITDHALILS